MINTLTPKTSKLWLQSRIYEVPNILIILITPFLSDKILLEYAFVSMIFSINFILLVLQQLFYFSTA